MLPNFFIVGAPKSGTTALASYLQSHPNVFLSTPKEPHYFATDLPRYRAATSEAEYRHLFHESTRDHLAIGEASVWYLYSDAAIKNIFRFNPQSKIIIMLRNPVEMVYSMHSQHLYSLDEDQLVFYEAWKLQDQRKNGKFIPKHCREPKTLMYAEIAKFGFQVERVFSIFPRHQVSIIIFDDFKEDTASIYHQTLGFLDLANDNRRHFPRINVNRRHRYDFLAQFMHNPPDALRMINRLLKKKLGSNLNWTRRLLKKLNAKVENRKPLPDDFRREIMAFYKDDIIMLSQLIDRPLNNWFGEIDY